MHPKVLIVMTTPYSTSDSSRTLDAYFHYWEKDRVAQIFSRNWIPNKGHCAEMFQITDANLLKKWLHQPANAGKIYTYEEMRSEDGNHVLQGNAISTLGYKFGVRHSPGIELLRGVLWRHKYWCTSELVNWMDQFKPDVVLYNFSNHLFTQQIALFAAERYGIPIVAVIGDDYYFNDRPSLSPVYKLFRHTFKKLTEKILSHQSSAVYCSDKIKEKYNNYFHIHGDTVYINSSLQRCDFQPINKNNPKIVYFGSIRLGRNLALREIADALAKIDSRYKLEVYSNESDATIFGMLKDHPNVIYGGGIPYSQVKEKIADSDIFVIAEGFRKEDINFTKYSLSTKAADGLACGHMILAYGPKDAGVIGYMEETGAAQVCTNRNQLSQSITELIRDVDLQKRYYEKAIEVFNRNHTLASTTATFKSILQNVISTKK